MLDQRRQTLAQHCAKIGYMLLLFAAIDNFNRIGNIIGVAHTKRWPSARSVLFHRLRRWTNTEPALRQHLVVVDDENKTVLSLGSFLLHRFTESVRDDTSLPRAPIKPASPLQCPSGVTRGGGARKNRLNLSRTSCCS